MNIWASVELDRRGAKTISTTCLGEMMLKFFAFGALSVALAFASIPVTASADVGTDGDAPGLPKIPHPDESSTEPVRADQLGYLVVTSTLPRGPLAALIEAQGGTLAFRIGTSNTWQARFPSPAHALEARDLLAESLGIDGVKADTIRRAIRKNVPPNDPLYHDSWHLNSNGANPAPAGFDVRAEAAWTAGYRGAGITIAIMDDGVDTAHPDLSLNVSAVASSFDYLDNDPNAIPTEFDDDHGTRVAGIAAAVTHNNLGVAGIARDARFVSLRIFSSSGSIASSSMAAAWNHELANIDIFSGSFGDTDYGALGDIEYQAVNTGLSTGRGGMGAIYVMAGGNERDTEQDANAEPMSWMPGIIKVAAVESTTEFADYSSPGECLLVCAPTELHTTDWSGVNGVSNGDYDTLNGSSASTPLVSGVIALMLSANPNLTWRDVQHILVNSSRKIDPAHPSWSTNAVGKEFSRDYGFGMVDAQAATQMAVGFQTVPPQVIRTGTDSPGVAIPDNNAAWISRTLNIAQTVITEQVVLTMHIQHDFWRDFRVEVESPAGTVSPLIFESSSPTAYAGDNDAPGIEGYPGTDQWKFKINRFWGEQGQGTWTLRIADRQAADTGTLVSWQLDVFGSLPGNPPDITSISPSSGRPGDTIQVLGTNFTGADLKFNGASTPWTAITGGLEFDVPATAAVGSATVQLTTINGSDSIGFTVDPPPQPPVINVISPNPVKRSELLTINGSSLAGASVTIGGLAHAVTVLSSAQVRLTVAGNTPLGTQTLVLTTALGSTQQSVTVEPAPVLVPLVTSVNPSQADIGTQVSIQGANLASATVEIGNVAQTILSNTDSQIVVEVSLQTPQGSQSVEVTTVGGTSSRPIEIFVPASLIPALTVVPTGPWTKGQQYTIEGTALTGVQVLVNGIVQTVQSANDTSISFTLGSSTPTGAGAVIVSNSFGGASRNVTVVNAIVPIGSSSGGGGGGGCAIRAGQQGQALWWICFGLGVLVLAASRSTLRRERA